MSSEQLQFLFALFSFVGVVGTLFYLILEKAKSDEQSDRVEILQLKVDSLQDYLYELDARFESVKRSEESDIKEKIIEMHREGKELMAIENAVDVPRAKIEMVIKFYELREKSDNLSKSVEKEL